MYVYYGCSTLYSLSFIQIWWNAHSLAITAYRRELASCFHPGYAAAAAARGHSFRPVALSEFGGFAPSAMLALAGITHPGDELDADQEGERFFADGQSWATATHRAFTVHSLAASMCRAAYHAARSATSCRPISAPSR